MTNQSVSAPCSSFFLDQSPTNALATGDSQTFIVTCDQCRRAGQPLRVTLAWTDPPGNPAAAIKLVNNLEPRRHQSRSPANPVIYYGNDISTDSIFNTPWNTNARAESGCDQ